MAPPDGAASTQSAARPGFQIQPESRTDLHNYSEFTYMTATTTGLSTEASATADEGIEGIIDSVVGDAVAGDDNGCLVGEDKCGYFQQSLKPINCTDDYLCLQQDVTASPVGLAISDVQVAVLVLDPKTGRAANLKDVVTAKQRKNFLLAVNDAVATLQKAEEVYSASDPPDFTEADFAAWAPMTDGIHVWFPKYTAGPGAMGVVEVVVSESDVRLAARSRTAPRNPHIVSGWPDLYDYYCPRDPASLPRLVDASADPFATSVMQMLLKAFAYDPGPIDGAYGPVTRKAVRAFQEDMNLTVDGYVGPQTWTIFRTVCESEGQPAAGSSTQGNAGGDTTAVQRPATVTVPNVTGMSNRDAERSLRNSGLVASVRRSNGDSSIAAESNNECRVTTQQPLGGSQVNPQSTVAVVIDCPSTGYNAPALPQPYTGADSGQYNGPAPPPAWTGR